LGLSAEKTALEIGVGTGRLALRVLGTCSAFYGIDISPRALGKASENLDKKFEPALICDDFLAHKFDRTFDVIYSSLTWMHIKNKRKAVKKVAALLNKNGRFVLSVDKSAERIIEYNDTLKIEIYPDNIDKTIEILTTAAS
jgi:SAM-dependent methyltransferase